MQQILQEIESLKQGLQSKRGSGRTTKMIEEITEYAIANEGKKILVLAHSHEFADDIRRKLFENIALQKPIKQMVGSSIELMNGTIIMCKSESYRKDPYYKYGGRWDKEFQDHKIGDLATERLIFDMENSLHTPLIRRR